MFGVGASQPSNCVNFIQRHVDKALAVTAVALAVIGILAAFNLGSLASVNSYWFYFEIGALVVLVGACVACLRNRDPSSSCDVLQSSSDLQGSHVVVHGTEGVLDGLFNEDETDEERLGGRNARKDEKTSGIIAILDLAKSLTPEAILKQAINFELNTETESACAAYSRIISTPGEIGVMARLNLANIYLKDESDSSEAKKRRITGLKYLMAIVDEEDCEALLIYEAHLSLAYQLLKRNDAEEAFKQLREADKAQIEGERYWEKRIQIVKNAVIPENDPLARNWKKSGGMERDIASRMSQNRVGALTELKDNLQNYLSTLKEIRNHRASRL